MPIKMMQQESPCYDDRFDQIPLVAIEVLEDGHDAIRFMARRLDEPDAPLGVCEVVSGKVVRFEEQEYSTVTLVTNRFTLPVTDSSRQEQSVRCAMRRGHHSRFPSVSAMSSRNSKPSFPTKRVDGSVISVNEEGGQVQALRHPVKLP